MPVSRRTSRGRIEVDERYRTAVPHIYAVGDVIGFPSLASASAEQGRLAACDLFGIADHAGEAPLPIGIFSIPEISYVGKTEAELTEAMIPYEVGIAHYRELARGQILGETHGLVKLLVSPDDRTLLGVHAFGAGATEVVHIGQAVMGLGGTIDYLVDSVFNYPTFAEAYKVAALDALNKLRAVTLVCTPTGASRVVLLNPDEGGRMPGWLWVVIVVAALIIIGAVAMAATRARRSRELQGRFGPEYDRVAADAPSKRQAEAELKARAERHNELDLRTLDPQDSDAYRARWQDVQAKFVDDPDGAVQDADGLIQDVMRRRGYPVDDFDTRAADLSVDHPDVVENYRAAHGIAVARERGKAGTDELRRAIQHYRSLFDALVDQTTDRAEARS